MGLYHASPAGFSCSRERASIAALIGIVAEPAADVREELKRLLAEVEELVDRQAGVTDQRTECADRESLCWGIERFTRMPDFTSTRWLPTWPAAVQPARSKALAASLPEMLASLTIEEGDVLHSDQNRIASGRGVAGGESLLIFRPEPCRDGFLDVLQGFLLVLALGDASWECRALGNEPTVFRLLECHMKHHGRLLRLL
jgi:hypothetical protein